MTVVLGIDPAMGGGHATIAAELKDETLTILDCSTEYNFARTEQQLESIQRYASIYNPSVVIIEYDAQQKGLGNDERLDRLAQHYGFRVEPHITRMVKLDTTFGVAAMDQSFARGQIRIPYADPATRMKMEPLIHQLRAWRPDIPTKRLTQDLVMALWFVHLFWQRNKRAAMNQTVPRQPRPQWVMRDFRPGAHR
jgi:hypothetical protein